MKLPIKNCLQKPLAIYMKFMKLQQMTPPIKAPSFGRSANCFRHHFALSGWNFASSLGREGGQQGRFFIQWNSLTLKKSLSVDACLGCRDHKRCAEHCWWVALCKNKTIKSLRGNLPTKCRVVRLPTKFAKRFNQANLHSPIVFRLRKPVIERNWMLQTITFILLMFRANFKQL